jgi:hypothetical protein
MSSSKAPLAVFALVLGLGLPVLGCGHPATESECQLIVDKNVELQIKAMSAPPADVEKEKARVRAEMDPLLKGCVGRRITNRMLTCVRGANTVKEVDQCTR